ncbi:HD domain-containing protein [Halocola ammonii]
MAANQPNKVEIDVRQKWEELSSKFCDNEELRSTFLKEIEKQYLGKKRHYHTLTHLEYMFSRMEEVRDKLKDPEMFEFAIFYHDLIYKIQRKDNEEQSAKLAKERLLKLGVDEERAEHCKKLIESTETNDPQEVPDSDYLNDIDLGILGESPERYKDYTAKIRKEFSVYPDFLFNPGRKNVLNHFLERENIYQTEHFREKLEDQARKNISKELEVL